MRDIEFRAWFPYTESMLYNISYEKCDEYSKKNNPMGLVYQQYIGFKDKEGTKIYEGDIVKTPFIDKQIIELEEYIDGDGHISIGYLIRSFNKENIEVIGNIYQNPELLK